MQESLKTNSVVTALMLAVLFLACSQPSDVSFRERDKQLLAEYDKLHSDYQQGAIGRKAYLKVLQELREHELKLFNDVKKHDFRNITESNYWHRGRLKFPSIIEQELRLLNDEHKPVQADH
jgi:hypothetical protein